MFQGMRNLPMVAIVEPSAKSEFTLRVQFGKTTKLHPTSSSPKIRYETASKPL